VDEESLPATALTVALLKKYVTTQPPPPNAMAVSMLARRVAERAGDPFSHVLALQSKVAGLTATGRMDEASEMACRAAQLSRELGAPDLIASSERTTAYFLGQRHARRARDIATTVSALQPALRDQTLAVAASIEANEKTTPSNTRESCSEYGRHPLDDDLSIKKNPDHRPGPMTTKGAQ